MKSPNKLILLRLDCVKLICQYFEDHPCTLMTIRTRVLIGSETLLNYSSDIAFHSLWKIVNSCCFLDSLNPLYRLCLSNLQNFPTGLRSGLFVDYFVLDTLSPSRKLTTFLALCSPQLSPLNTKSSNVLCTASMNETRSFLKPSYILYESELPPMRVRGVCSQTENVSHT